MQGWESVCRRIAGNPLVENTNLGFLFLGYLVSWLLGVSFIGFLVCLFVSKLQSFKASMIPNYHNSIPCFLEDIDSISKLSKNL